MSAVKPADQITAITHGRPSPRKTFTEFEPVTLPTAASAYFSYEAAVIDAKVSGNDVPRATNVIAVTDGLIARTHPKRFANSPTTNVTIPIKASEITKVRIPPAIWGGGIKEKKTFHPMFAK